MATTRKGVRVAAASFNAVAIPLRPAAAPRQLARGHATVICNDKNLAPDREGRG